MFAWYHSSQAVAYRRKQFEASALNEHIIAIRLSITMTCEQEQFLWAQLEWFESLQNDSEPRLGFRECYSDVVSDTTLEERKSLCMVEEKGAHFKRPPKAGLSV